MIKRVDGFSTIEIDEAAEQMKMASHQTVYLIRLDSSELILCSEDDAIEMTRFN